MKRVHISHDCAFRVGDGESKDYLAGKSYDVTEAVAAEVVRLGAGKVTDASPTRRTTTKKTAAKKTTAKTPAPAPAAAPTAPTGGDAPRG